MAQLVIIGNAAVEDLTENFGVNKSTPEFNTLGSRGRQPDREADGKPKREC
jgi:hypothetical protein